MGRAGGREDGVGTGEETGKSMRARAFSRSVGFSKSAIRTRYGENEENTESPSQPRKIWV